MKLNIAWRDGILRRWFVALLWLALLPAGLGILSATPCLSQTPPSAAGGELVIGTKVAPPFAMKDENGHWSGISIELWQHLASRLKWNYRFVDAETVPALLDGVKAGKFDAAISAISITAEREQTMDFTTSYFYAGTGVAVQADRISNWMPVIRSLTSWSFVQAALTLLALAVGAGILIWLFERKANDGFSGGAVRGLSSGVWWSTHTMTQRAAGGIVPMTLPGRIIAMIWMVTSVIAIAVFTAGITSTLTTKRLHGMVNSVSDLSSIKVGVPAGTSSEIGLSRLRIVHSLWPSPQDGLKALRAGKIDAFVYDRPLLAWVIRQQHLSSVEVTDLMLEPQRYAIALHADSPLRKRLNVAMLEVVESDWWRDTLFRYLGTTR
ncbi:transporter substrate-binding domain-containing protein [[Pseudomonas] carboxydohydrogena]|uniref:Transporter substrate-binding domain-containing protein n=1 Tax=Afipia carboxydohydrogena TaxID=290 RepID=A0ABY8BSZ4_AFICR|nr:transporter substrate-binding domain-containing protein [[Pseudomonas] carboxydohydrogena]WEF52736.1 transporter substrate-binding domain-containing protein [[Pseudomonas] carboxydohydrogena]